jgi:hypothetical protein
MTATRSGLWIDLAASLAIGAGLVHASAAGTHAGDTTLVWMFAVTAVVQVAAGAAILGSPSRRNLLMGGVVNLATLTAWMTSRAVGLPLIDSLAGREAVGPQDLTAALLAAAGVLATVVALRPAIPSASARRVLWLPAFAVLPAVVGMAAPHAHDASHDHAHGTEEAAEARHDDTSEHAHDERDTGAHAADPVLVGADTSQASDVELAAAVELIDVTRTALDPTVTGTAVVSTADAQAAGYVWIGDGRRPGGFQHYVNPSFLADGHVLDPERIESLVFENTTDGPTLVSAMYILERGATMADVPDVAGDLTVWHDHQNLCWDETGTRLAGISTDGVTCRPGGELRGTAPMLHVWLTDQSCGPFAGIEGHGSTDCADHGH